jgi:hypothetical protein
LNNARVAAAPGDTTISAEVCGGAVARGAMETIALDELRPGRTFCLRTSDDHTGTVSITDVRKDALGGWVSISWTIWP